MSPIACPWTGRHRPAMMSAALPHSLSPAGPPSHEEVWLASASYHG